MTSRTTPSGKPQTAASRGNVAVDTAPGPTSRAWACSCDAEAAIDLLDDIAQQAARGDDDARRLLPAAIEHFLAAIRREAVL